MELERELARLREQVDQALEGCFREKVPYQTLLQPYGGRKAGAPDSDHEIL